MGADGLDEDWVPEHVKDYLRKLWFVLPLDDMEPWIRPWDDWMSARGEFYDYRGKAVDQLQMHLHGGMGFSADLSPSARRLTAEIGIENGRKGSRR